MIAGGINSYQTLLIEIKDKFFYFIEKSKMMTNQS